MPVIGVLALQGCVEPHRPHIEAMGCRFRAVKTQSQIESVDSLILPGGESTTMLKLITVFDLKDCLQDAIGSKPVWGICAGAILLAQMVISPEQESLNALDIKVVRNAYGRHLDSHQAECEGYPVSFIRAPVIESVGRDVGILWEKGGHPVWVKQGHVMATTFHPEMTLDAPSPMHLYFKDLMASATVSASVSG